MTVPEPLVWLEVIGALVGGFVLGLVHFGTLASVSEDYLAGRTTRALALHLLRMAVMVAALIGLVQLGAMPLLAGALGIVAARAVVLRRTRREP
ncbi:N-ATPase subunit AtpR [Novosphingobium malaysiense]|uniref:N-ATPase subunit AtpR n=1 Tax=Novosphingobium malaysiense TaxID=1348853 RepID=UPI00068DB63A|nr:ATP synthase subunit I [Novosphingobium malaysiense]